MTSRDLPRRPEAARFGRHLETRRRQVDRALDRCLPPPGDTPPRLLRAMRYSLLAPGKRVRPILALEAARAVGGRDRWALPAACALEMVHAYSLIHDDLPAMDDDRWRRGRPTAHVKFGEALAILSGDALLTLAFQILAGRPSGDRFAGRRNRVVALIAGAAGMEGMVGGQVRDLEAEGRGVSRAFLTRIHRGKTGALLTASAVAGGILGGGTPPEVAALARYGRSVGLAFQIVDDILDEEGTRADLGKSPGKDRARHKATYPSLWGLEESRRLARRAVSSARRALGRFGRRGDRLSALAEFILARDR